MVKQYQWQVSVDAVGPIAAGVLSGDTSLHTTDVLTGTATAQYYYLDSNVVTSGTANTSRVVIQVTDTWNVSFDSRNNLIVSVSSVIDSIVRDNVNGNPAGPSNLARDMNAYQYEGGTSLWYYRDTNISEAKTIATNINLGTHEFILTPGQMASRHSMFFFNKTVGAQSAGDRLNMGVKFVNILPPDYRPGATLDSNRLWQSHNREAGKAHILGANGKYIEMRTIAGLEDSDNSPSIRVNDKWFNQRKIGKE